MATAGQPLTDPQQVGYRTTQAYRQRLFRRQAYDELPVTLRHERIYILPTPRGLAFLGVISLMLLASVNYQLNLGYALGFILTGLFCACLFSAYRNLAGVAVISISSDECFAPGPLLFHINFAAQKKREHYSIEIHQPQTGPGVLMSTPTDITTHSTSRATLALPDVKRGLNRLGRLTLTSQYPLGLWRAWGYVHAPANCLVFPQPEPIAPPIPNPGSPFKTTQQAHHSSSAHTSISPGGDEFDSLRKWQSGDPFSAVAWKTVARGQGWHSKKFASAQPQPSPVLSWRQLASSLSQEQKVSRFCRWIIEADKHHCRYTVELPGLQSNTGGGAQLKQRALRHLATLPHNADSHPSATTGHSNGAR